MFFIKRFIIISILLYFYPYRFNIGGALTIKSIKISAYRRSRTGRDLNIPW